MQANVYKQQCHLFTLITACKCEVSSNVLISLKVSAVPQASVSIEEPITRWLCAGGPAVPSLNTQQKSPETPGLTRAAQSPAATHALCQRSCAVRSTQWSSPHWIQTEARSSSVTAGCIQVMDFKNDLDCFVFFAFHCIR